MDLTVIALTAKKRKKKAKQNEKKFCDEHIVHSTTGVHWKNEQ